MVAAAMLRTINRFIRHQRSLLSTVHPIGDCRDATRDDAFRVGFPVWALVRAERPDQLEQQEDCGGAKLLPHVRRHRYRLPAQLQRLWNLHTSLR